MDRRTDGRTDRVIPIYPQTLLAGVIMSTERCSGAVGISYSTATWVLVSYSFTMYSESVDLSCYTNKWSVKVSISSSTSSKADRHDIIEILLKVALSTKFPWPFFIGHCIVCPSSNYGFWLLLRLRYLQNFLITFRFFVFYFVWMLFCGCLVLILFLFLYIFML
jgi:hypothetical protein